MGRSRFWWLTGGLLAAAILVVCYREEANNTCEKCSSRLKQVQWRVGLWRGPNLPLTPLRRQIKETLFLREQMNGLCAHQWVLGVRSPEYMIRTKWGGYIVGRGAGWSTLVTYYEEVPEFRVWLIARDKEGRVDPADFVAAAQLTEDPARIQTPRDRELQSLGFSLQHEYRREHPLK